MDDEARRESIDVVLTLLAEKGFDATSTAEIADATGIPAEDVMRSIGTKDAIVLKVAEDMLGSVVKALTDIDPQTPLVEALMTAHSSVVADIVAGAGPVTPEHMRRMGKAITSSTDCRKRWALNVSRCSPLCSSIASGHRRRINACSRA